MRLPGPEAIGIRKGFLVERAILRIGEVCPRRSGGTHGIDLLAVHAMSSGHKRMDYAKTIGFLPPRHCPP
jgi:hypothetical protein